MTIGPGILLLGWLENMKNGFADFLNIYGRVPFFYYVLHFYIIHTVLVVVFFIYGFGVKDIVPPNSPILFQPPGLGFELPVIYLIWAGVVLSLYYPCRWFNKYKSTHRQWWLSYL